MVQKVKRPTNFTFEVNELTYNLKVLFLCHRWAKGCRGFEFSFRRKVLSKALFTDQNKQLCEMITPSICLLGLGKLFQGFF